jgi:hypothetical protein
VVTATVPCALIGLNLVNLIGADLAPDPDVSLIAAGSLRGLALLNLELSQEP